LVNKNILRGEFGECMEEMEINAESKILVEYIPKIKKPELLQKKDAKNDIYLI
jgi:hypothetical protein